MVAFSLLATVALATVHSRRQGLNRPVVNAVRTCAPVCNSLPWVDLCAELDQLPAFVVVDSVTQTAFVPKDEHPRMHVNVDAARAELAAARSRASPGLELRLQPVGLGFALTRSGGAPLLESGSQYTAVLVPSASDVRRARGLAGGDEIDWDRGDEVPLFFCFQLAQRRADRLVTPLYLCAAEADKALDAAQVAAGADGADGAISLTLRATSLQTIARLIVDGGVRDPTALRFVPSRAAIALAAELVPLQEASTEEASTEEEARHLRSAASAPGAPAPTEAIARQALTSLLDGSRTSSRQARDAGVFPDERCDEQ